jgi:phage N-6-adenine-methyltransferase
MKDENDAVTGDVFVTLEQLQEAELRNSALSSGGHYQHIKPLPWRKVSGRRYAGTTTPDSVRDKWSTHRDVIEYMKSRYGEYDLDAAASAENTVCVKFYSQETNCLVRWWGTNKHVWLNPPYSNPMPFVMKSIEQMEHNNQIDLLLPADNSTQWFREAQQSAAEIIWIVASIDDDGSCRSGRLAFISGDTGEPVDNNNKGSVIFIMRKLKEGEEQKTHYVCIDEICPSVKLKRKVNRNKKAKK